MQSISMLERLVHLDVGEQGCSHQSIDQSAQEWLYLLKNT